MFKIGDKVIIKKGIEFISDKEYSVEPEMLQYIGKKTEIISVFKDSCFLKIDDGAFYWRYNWIEKITDENMTIVSEDHCQEAKADAGKLQMMLMLPAINRSVVRVREYGILKYKDKDNWKKVSIERWENALVRHLMEYIKDRHSVDEESGLRHIDHIACNLAYILENMEGEGNGK